jgi:hypothetical protein
MKVENLCPAMAGFARSFSLSVIVKSIRRQADLKYSISNRKYSIIWGLIMQLINLRDIPRRTILLWIACIISSLTILVACSDNHDSANPPSTPTDADSFTFFDLAKTTELTKDVRRDLSNKLGRDAIEGRSILDLEINYKGFLQTYLPELEKLNRQLNFPPGERVEHNTVKLMYRYAQKQNVPFDFVELVFSDYTKKPLRVRIDFKSDEANTVPTLRQKYGQPEMLDWNQGNGKSMIWQKDGDYLIVSHIPDRFGRYEYQIVIYYVDNLKQLIDTERKEKEAKEQQRVKTGKKAF